MKIAILSMQRIFNYGSVLQAYSLKKMIEDISGEKVYFLDVVEEDCVWLSNPLRQDKDDYAQEPYVDSSDICYLYKRLINRYKVHRLRGKIRKFQREVLGLSEDTQDIHFDLVVEGSDEVFKSVSRIRCFLYGAVPNTDKLITYAAACGNSCYEGIPAKKVDYIRNMMNNFNAMSVRDQHTKDYIGKLYDGEIEEHMDPVLMGNLCDREHCEIKMKKFVVVYAYGDRIRTREEITVIKAFAKARRLKTVAIGAPQYWCDLFVAVSPFEALDYFYYAEYVVTDTFHGAAFSIINHCRFAVIVRKSNENKLKDLLYQLHLEDRIVTRMRDLDALLQRPIEYDKVDCMLEGERKRARAYLEKYCVK